MVGAESLVLGVNMKTKITFKLKSKTCVGIIRDGEQIGHMWSESKDGTLPYPHDDNKVYCQNSIQLCGFDRLDGAWACGIYEGKRDLVVQFRNDKVKYTKEKLKEYEDYVKRFFETRSEEVKTGKETFHIGKMKAKKDLGKLQNFDDWFRSCGVFSH